jgi:hypothetical protein
MELDTEQQSSAENLEQLAATEGEPLVTGEEAAPENVETDEEKNARVQAEASDRARVKEEKRQASVQRRFDELTADKYAERKRADSLEAELNRLRTPTQSADQPKTGAPKREDFEDYADFVRADAKYEAVEAAKQLIESDRRAAQELQNKSTQEKARAAAESQFVERRTAIEKTIPDYKEVIADWDPKIPDSVVEMIVKLEQGPMIVYHLAKNPNLESQFRNAPEEMRGILMGQLIASLKSPTKVSAAPAPGKPVSASISTSGTGYYTGPAEGYMAWANKNLRRI